MNDKTWREQAWGEPVEREEKKRFRNVYVIKPGPYELSTIKPMCEEIIYATDGYASDVGEMHTQLTKSLRDFDPNKDLLIAVGSANACVLAATIISRRIASSTRKDWDSFCLAVYTNQSYLFWRVPVLGPLTEPYEFTDR